jgi:ParB family chromosome partitioning protein
VTATLRGAAVQVHYQGVAVPHLAARNDVAGLAAVAGNRGFPEEARLGAIEGLAAAASEAAEAELVRIGQAEGEPEELRKAAWRGLRRSRRARAKAGPPR